MPTVNCSPFGPKPQFELADGTPAVGNKLFFYVAGSVNTKQNTYTNSTGATANANPLILNSLGMPATEIWFTDGQTYKVVYAPSTDSDPPTSPIWSIDNLVGINDQLISAQTEWVAFSGAPTFVSTVSFTLVGDQTSTLHVGRRIKTTNSGGTIYSIITASAFGAVTLITVVNDSGVLDSGISAVSYGLLSSVNPSTPLLTDQHPVASGSADKTKKVRLEVDLLTTATTRVMTVVDRDITLSSPTANAQTGATYTVVAADHGKVITLTNAGAIAVALTAAATLGSGFWCWIKNIGLSTATLDANGTELIRFPGGLLAGDQTMTLPYSGSTTGPYNVSGVMLWCDGTGFEVISTLETHGSEEFLAGGTWTCPSGVTAAFIHAGGGGGGGGSATNGAAPAAGGGGGAGNAVTGVKVAVIPGTAYTVTIGAGGATGAAGGTTSIGALVSVTGGTAGTNATDTGGSGGASNGRGGGGGSGVLSNFTGHGGCGPFGGGARSVLATADITGSAAGANSCAGGSGASRTTLGTSNGGAGGSGYLRVTW